MNEDIRSLNIAEIEAVLGDLGEPAYRARQLFAWLHAKMAASYDEMSNLPKSLRETLAQTYPLAPLEIVQKLTSKLDGTEKYLFRLADGHVIESVRMLYSYGASVCISTQVGCRMGCRFCASTLDGMERDLTAGEMLEQVYRIERESGQRVSHVVLMGSGEPLDNMDNVLRFLRLITAEEGQNLSMRNITVSTCGLVPEIRMLAKEAFPITLAVSLHAPTDEKRREIMPIANKYPLSELIAACRDYFAATGRRVTFEYALVAGQNDRDADARQLAHLLDGFPAHVNLIPVNPIKERGYAPPGRSAVADFHKMLEKYGINSTIRRGMGADIEGACGQLRKRYKEQDREIEA
ncbi:MAG: 23S rRNA (adenine(2503)-C(2))-methyltransferase RlmN [Firmicutes bacterium]|nr:23S rRNA (adenine(2503)-C(2))-methyltransferase RlmN [Bacillota bacterium]